MVKEEITYFTAENMRARSFVLRRAQDSLRYLLFLMFSAVTLVSYSQLPAIKISPNKKYFQTTDGKPFFWLGDTGWLLFIKLTREETIQYLDTRKQQGYNVIQVMVLHDLKHAVNKYGDSALLNENIATPKVSTGNDFWDHVDFVIDAAAQRGLYMALVPVWGTNVKSGWVTQQQAKTYATFLANRYKNKSNIIWLNGGDINGSDSIKVWNMIGSTLNSIDKNHLITFHPRGRTTSSRWFHNESWLDFNMFQSGHRNYAQDTSKGETHYGEDNWKYIDEDFSKQPLKPTLDGEPSYEGIPEGLHDTTQRFWNDDDVRRYAYWSVFAGGAGFTYGHSAVMQFYNAADKGRAYGAKKFWQEAINDSGALQMQYLSKLMLSKPYFERVPDQSLIENNGQRYDRVVATRGKNYAFIYTYTGRSFTVNMRKIAASRITATWYDPRSGKYFLYNVYSNSGNVTFNPPGNEQPGNDWVLVLEPTAKNGYLFTSFNEPANEGLRMLYSYDGYAWKDIGTTLLKPAVGDQKVMRDPSIAQGPDGVFHLVWTSSWRGDKGFGYASSKDLVHWSEQQFIPVMQHEPSTVNVWAPEIFYDEDGKKFIIIWASTLPGRFDRGIEEDSNNHRMYITTTTDFKTFSPTKLFLDPGFSVIDAVIVKRAANDYVLVLKDNTRPNRNIKVAYATKPEGPYTNVSAPFTGSFTEGPSVVKVDNNWLIYYDAYRKGTYDAMSTKDFKSFTDISSVVSVPPGHKHGTVFPVKDEVIEHLLKQTAKQDTVRYIGKTLSNVDYHHGQLRPAVGVHNIQVFRANRQYPEKSGNPNYFKEHAPNWTYNHAPMLAYWEGRFQLNFLSNPVGEHVAPGQTFAFSSPDGYNWIFNDTLFPTYKLRPGTVKAGKKDTAGNNDYAVMHQRIGYYTAKNGVLLALGYYGIVLGQKDDPNDGNGIGRVVRRVNLDGSFGPIYFLRYNHAFNEKNTDFPFYKSSSQKDFLAACDELLASPLQMQQMVEEADRDDPLIPLKKDFKAFSYYRLPDTRVVGLWKYALTSISADSGKTWQYNPTRAPGFVNANAKIWGQRTSDGRYATVYNPSEFRWPLAVSVSDDGLNYKNLLLVNGEITSMRYGGAYKSYGPQYVRGIQEIDGNPPGGNMWVTYSMNKEDIWVSKIPVPVTEKVDQHVNDQFAQMNKGDELKYWNIFSPLWCRVQPEDNNNQKAIALHDSDPFDYAKAERVFPESKKVVVEFGITPKQNDHGLLEIELVDGRNTPCLRLSFDSTGSFQTKAGYRNRGLSSYKAGEKLDIKIELNTTNRFYTVYVNGKSTGNNICFAPVEAVERIVFRTGVTRRFPDADTPTDQSYDLPGAGEQLKDAAYFIHYLKTSGSN
jgi:hypothetical protein